MKMSGNQQSRQQTDKEKMEAIMKNVGICLDMGEDGTAVAYGEWDLERKQDFIASILGGGKKKKAQPEMWLECCMCGEKTRDRESHNARPIYEDRCCEDCNSLVLTARMGLLPAEEIKEKIISHFKSQKHFIWRSLRDGMLKLKKGDYFNPIDIIRKASEKRIRDEENHEKERLRRQKEREERTKRLREEEERLERIEEERKVRDAEETKKRQEDFEARLKALEVREAERKEEEKREKERKAREAEERKAKKEAEKAEERKKKFEGKRK